MFERFISHRFLTDGNGRRSGSLTHIATASIALGVLVMILSVCILRGFQREIEQKVVGFGAHLMVKNYEVVDDYNSSPISRSRPEVQRIVVTPGVAHLQCYAEKGGMVKTADQIHGILFKGVDSGYDTAFFHNNLISGHFPTLTDSSASNEILVSQRIADKLQLKLGDKVRTYFWQNDNYRARAFTISGIYCSDLADFDELYLVGDLRQLQRINGWTDDEVGGYEITVTDLDRLPQVKQAVVEQLGYDLTLTDIREQNPALFSWLNLLNSNIWLILGVMTLVCVVAIISSFLILVFEKTSTIGILKVLGATNRSVKRIFLIKSTSIILRGIAIGDALALLLCWLQQHFHLIHLDRDSYSMAFVPIQLSGWTFVIVSLGTLAACWLALLLPATFVTHVQPAKTVKVN